MANVFPALDVHGSPHEWNFVGGNVRHHVSDLLIFTFPTLRAPRAP